MNNKKLKMLLVLYITGSVAKRIKSLPRSSKASRWTRKDSWFERRLIILSNHIKKIFSLFFNLSFIIYNHLWTRLGCDTLHGKEIKSLNFVTNILIYIYHHHCEIPPTATYYNLKMCFTINPHRVPYALDIICCSKNPFLVRTGSY